jgi:hypothetical protein
VLLFLKEAKLGRGRHFSRKTIAHLHSSPNELCGTLQQPQATKKLVMLWNKAKKNPLPPNGVTIHTIEPHAFLVGRGPIGHVP